MPTPKRSHKPLQWGIVVRVLSEVFKKKSISFIQPPHPHTFLFLFTLSLLPLPYLSHHPHCDPHQQQHSSNIMSHLRRPLVIDMHRGSRYQIYTNSVQYTWKHLLYTQSSIILLYVYKAQKRLTEDIIGNGLAFNCV